MNKETTKMIPGDELHLTMLMAPYSLNLVTGQDRQHLLAFGRAAFDAGKADRPAQCLHQIAEPDTQEPFMWAIQGPDGSAYMDEGCVSSIREDVQAEVDGLNSGLDANDEPYQVVPVYLAAAPQAVQVIKANCYSDDNGDYWRDCPDDCDFVDGLKVGDTYELQASIRAWSETFRVTKAPDETSDDYEVELVSTDAPLAATQPAPAIFGGEDHVLVPRGLIGAACYAIDKKRDGTKTLAELRRYTTGDLSAATQPAAQGVEANSGERLDRLYFALEVCSAELFAQCAEQKRPMKYIEQARSALAAEQCARAALAAQAKHGEQP